MATRPGRGRGHRFRIGGERIAVRCADHPLVPESDPDYLPFLRAADRARPSITVDLLTGAAPAPPRAPVVLEAGGSWSVGRDGRAFVLAPRSGAPGRPPSWSARIDREDSSGWVRCEPELLVPLGRRLALQSPFHYPLDQLALMLLAAGRAVVVHAAGVQIGDRGVVLAGPSGAGKTTVARLVAAAGHAVLSDDRVVLRRERGGFTLHGTPWPGEGRFVQSRAVPLRALLFLARGPRASLRALAPAAAGRRLLAVSSVPWYDAAAAEEALGLLDALVRSVRAAEFALRPGRAAVAFLERAFR